MNLNLSGYKKMKVEDRVTTLQSPEGHEVRIAHQPLSEKLKRELDKMPIHQVKGGEIQPNLVDQNPVQQSQPEDQFNPVDIGRAPATIAPMMPGEPPSEMSPQLTPNPSQPQMPSQEQINPYDPGVLKVQSYEDQLKALGMGAQSQSNRGHQELAGQAEYRRNAEDQMAEHLTNLDEIKDEYDASMAAHNNGEIKPNNIFENKSTGQKIGLAIGLILGGMGSGLTGGPNPAMQFLENQIQRDVDAQKNNVNSIRNAYLKMTGDENLSYQMAMNLQKGIYASKMESAASASRDPAAAAALLAGSAKLKGELAQSMMTMANTSALSGQGPNRSMASGQEKYINPEYLPKDQQERVVSLPTGGQRFATGKADEAKAVRETFTGLSELTSKLNRVEGLLNKHASDLLPTFPGSPDNKEGNAAREDLITSINKLQDLKRFTKEEADRFEEMIPHPGTWNTEAGRKQLDYLRQTIAEKYRAEYLNHLEGFNKNNLPDFNQFTKYKEIKEKTR